MSVYLYIGFPGGSIVRNPRVKAGNTGLITELERSPGEGYCNPLQYSCLANPMVYPWSLEGYRSLEGYSPWGWKRLPHDWATKQQQQQQDGREGGTVKTWALQQQRVLQSMAKNALRISPPHFTSLHSDHSNFLNPSIPLPSLKKKWKSSSGNLCYLTAISHNSQVLSPNCKAKKL